MDNRKPRVGIMTWYTYRNYGSALQASALSYKIRTLGYEPCMICYQPKGDAVVRRDAAVADYLLRPFHALKRRRNRQYISQKRERLFAEYMDVRVSQTSPRNTYPELYALNGELDAFVCGSDQIWAPSCFDDKYFLSFVEDSGKKVAYAPSIGLPEVKESAVRSQMAKWISQVRYLSVREQQGAAIIKELTGLDAKVVADPTLLLNAREWDAFAETASTDNIEGDYIVCYFLGEADRYMTYVRSLAQKTGMRAYLIPVTKRQAQSADAVPFEVGPSEFVSLVRNAKYVCTDSFHGMAFSLNYGTPFFVFKRFSDNDPKNQNSRILSLLKLVGMENRLVDPNEQPDGDLLTCDFSGAEAALEALRKDSAAYLKNALAHATAEKADHRQKSCRITDMCCGCGACAAVCSQNAVTVCQNENGFEHYTIDQDKCIRCGRCRAVCPFGQITAPYIRASRKLYAVKSVCQSVLKSASSGGVGWELASAANSEGAWVCGCVYDAAANAARHILISPDEGEKLPLLRGSKYIQSISADALVQISRLPKDAKLYFFGTPCQCAAVDKLLCSRKYRENAVIVEVICHGVPSHLLWERYLREVDRDHGTGSHPNVIFRRKDLGWRNRKISISGNGARYEKNEITDDFYAIFRRGLCDMRTCFDCPYRERSGADIRMGDYWGPRFEKDKTGVSMVIANTVRGQEVVEALLHSGACSVQEYPLEEYWTVQYPYNHPVPVFRQELIDALRRGDRSVSQLRREYCSSYDMDERYSNFVVCIKKLLRKGRAQ